MALSCPRCLSANLDEIEIGEVMLDRCARCAGLWFDSAEIGALVGRHHSASKIDLIIPAAQAVEASLKCPRCADIDLRRLILDDQRGQKRYLYRCVSCLGTWLDRGELKEQEDARLAEILSDYFSELA